MAKDKKKKIDSSEKLEIAQRIAASSPHAARTYATIENIFVYISRGISGLLNKILMSTSISKLFALALAVLMYFGVNYSSSSALGVKTSATLNNIPVVIVYNSEMYEVSGVPEKCDVIVSGDMTDINLQKNQTNSNLVCDLSGLTEGNYTIKLTPSNFNTQLEVNVLNTPSVNVTIKKKMTSKFNISYEFINTNQMASKYTLSEPVFDTTEVLIRASEDTISSISFVKALIDTSGYTSDFTTEARVVAYDNNGNIVSCDIIPEKVNATVAVTEVSKEVPIVVRPVGEIMEGYAIDSISLDYSVVTLYAPKSVLNLIDAVYVNIDATQLTSTSNVFATNIDIPSGVNSMSVTKINMEITVDKQVKKTVKNVRVSWINYDDTKYRFKVVNAEDAEMDVVVYGTQKNLDLISADDISINIDLANVVIGQQQAPLIVSGSNNLVKYEIAGGRTYIEVEIVGVNE
ncbi:MAG: hypothetical protein K6A14_01565 [Erysipelotrichaceae bacterium]|nr:hypothetical protein [Erysipelotrichaceae bacterium]